MRDLLDVFYRHLADRHAERTRGTYLSIASAFLGGLTLSDPTSTPTRADVEDFLARPRRDGQRRAVSSRNQALVALRALGRLAVRDGFWTSDPTTGIPLARRPAIDPVVPTLDEVRELFRCVAGVSRPAQRARNLALLAILAHGLRVHEAVRVDVVQFDPVTGTILGVHGKGGTVHDAPLASSAVAILAAWVAERAERTTADEPALFVNDRGGRLSVRAVQHLMVRLRSDLRTLKKLTPHSLRHGLATGLIALGIDLPTVAGVLRHSDIRTTQRYVHLGADSRRDAVRRFGVVIPPDVLPTPAPSGANAPAIPEQTATAGLPATAETLAPMGTQPLDAHCAMGEVDEAA